MTIEEINKVFDFLWKELKDIDDFSFKLNSGGNIDAYFVNKKGNNETFGQFYTTRILKYLKEKEENGK